MPTVSSSNLAGPGTQFFDNNGNLLIGGKIYSYDSGTTDPQDTYLDAFGVDAHTNPIILDSAGRVPGGSIYLIDNRTYKFVFADADDNVIGTWDNIVPYATSLSTFSLNSQIYNINNRLDEMDDFGVVVSRTTNQTITPGSPVKIEFDAGTGLPYFDPNTSDAIPQVWANYILCFGGAFTPASAPSVGDTIKLSIHLNDTFFEVLGKIVVETTSTVSRCINASKGVDLFDQTGVSIYVEITSAVNWEVEMDDLFFTLHQISP